MYQGGPIHTIKVGQIRLTESISIEALPADAEMLPTEPLPQTPANPPVTKLEASEEQVKEYVRNLSQQDGVFSRAGQFLLGSGLDDIAGELQFGFVESKHFTCGNRCDRCGNYPALTIPLLWNGQLVGLKYRNLEAPDKEHKWTQAKGSKGDFLWLADLPPVDPTSKAVAILEGIRDTALARAQGFNSTGILSTSSITNSERFQESINRIKQTYKHAILIGDSDEPGKEAMQELREFFDTAATFSPLPKGVKDLSEFYEKSGAEAMSAWLRNVNKAMVGLRPFSGDLPASDSEFETVPIADVPARNVEWLWPNRIVKNKLTVFGGNPDTGKSTVAFDVIARVTRGKDWPDSPNENKPQHVLLMSAEDDPSDTIRPRLEAAGANLEFVHLLKSIRVPKYAKLEQRHIALDTDIAKLKKEIEKRGNIGLVVIDPISSYVGKIDMNKEVEIRKVLVPLREVAEETDTAILAIAHFNKRGDVNAIHKIAGAVAMTGVPRSVWVFLKNPEARAERIMSSVKNNLTKVQTGLKYAFEGVTLHDIHTSRVNWGDTYEEEADDTLEKERNPFERKEARVRGFLSEILARGEVAQEQIMARARKEGIGTRTVYEAKKELRIRSAKHGDKWYWSLPEEPPEKSVEDEASGTLATGI